MYKRIGGNIFQYKSKMPITNTVNTRGALGKGLAKEFAERDKSYAEDYKTRIGKELKQGGDVYFHKNNNTISFATKEDWANPTKEEYIDKGLANLKKVMQENNLERVAIPRLGSGLGGLDFDKQVMPLIEKHFGKEANHHLVIVDDKMPLAKSLENGVPKFDISITGTRDLNGKELPQQVKDFIQKHAKSITHGDAEGTDKLAGSFAKELGIKTNVIPAHWKGQSEFANDATGTLMPKLRNHNILDSGEVTLGVYSKMQGGTTHTLNQSFLRGKPTYFYDINKPEEGIQKMKEYFDRAGAYRNDMMNPQNETASKIGSSILQRLGRMSKEDRIAFAKYHQARSIEPELSGLTKEAIEKLIGV